MIQTDTREGKGHHDQDQSLILLHERDIATDESNDPSSTFFSFFFLIVVHEEKKRSGKGRRCWRSLVSNVQERSGVVFD